MPDLSCFLIYGFYGINVNEPGTSGSHLSITLTIQEAETRRMVVQSQHRQTLREILSRELISHTHTKKGVVGVVQGVGPKLKVNTAKK
jgi:hypothetical protein